MTSISATLICRSFTAGSLSARNISLCSPASQQFVQYTIVVGLGRLARPWMTESKNLGYLRVVSIDQCSTPNLEHTYNIPLATPRSLPLCPGSNHFPSPFLTRELDQLSNARREALGQRGISALKSNNQSTTDEPSLQLGANPSLETSVKLFGRTHTSQVYPAVLLRIVSKIAAASYTDQS